MIEMRVTKDGVIAFKSKFETQELAEAFFESSRLQGYFGKEAREELDEMGIPTGNIIPQEFSVQYVDVSTEVLTEKERQEALQYLKDTDFYIIREMDAGTPCPAEIKAARAAARLKI